MLRLSDVSYLTPIRRTHPDTSSPVLAQQTHLLIKVVKDVLNMTYRAKGYQSQAYDTSGG